MSFTISIVICLGILMFTFIALAYSLKNEGFKIFAFILALGFSWVMYALLIEFVADASSSIQKIVLAGYQFMVSTYIAIFVLIFVYGIYHLFKYFANMVVKK